VVQLRGVDAVSAATADAQHADPVRIHQWVVAEEVHARGEVLDADGGVFHETRFAGAVAVVRGVEGYGDVALLGEQLGVQPRGLLLHTEERVTYEDGRWPAVEFRIEYAAVQGPSAITVSNLMFG
jgi:hypothetical protein